MNPAVDGVQPKVDGDVFDEALCIARQSLYRFAALTLIDPRRDTWEQLSHPSTAQLAQAAAAPSCAASRPPKPSRWVWVNARLRISTWTRSWHGCQPTRRH